MAVKLSARPGNPAKLGGVAAVRAVGGREASRAAGRAPVRRGVAAADGALGLVDFALLLADGESTAGDGGQARRGWRRRGRWRRDAPGRRPGMTASAILRAPRARGLGDTVPISSHSAILRVPIAMNPSDNSWLRTARWLAFGSGAAIMVGIAPSQILLALAFAALLACGEQLRLPRIRVALGLFLLGTVISLAFSDDPARRAAADSEILCVSGIAGHLFAAAQCGDGAAAVSQLGGDRRSDGDPRLRAVRRQGAGGAPAGPELLRFLRRRADHRFYQPLEHLLGGGDVRADHAAGVSVLRARHAQVALAGMAMRALDRDGDPARARHAGSGSRWRWPDSIWSGTGNAGW